MDSLTIRQAAAGLASLLEGERARPGSGTEGTAVFFCASSQK